LKTSYLLQRRQGWYARKKIPVPLQVHFAKKEIIETLKTRDKDVAKRRLPLKLAEIEQRFSAARGATIHATKHSPKIENLIATTTWLREEQQGNWNHSLQPHELFSIALEQIGTITKNESKQVRQLQHLLSIQMKTL